MASTTSKYQFPQVKPPLKSGETGIASLSHPGVGTLRFRTQPKQFDWTYTLNKRIDQTYGGRVIQLLGTKIDDFAIKADCGAGGWAEANRVALFMRDVMVSQRDGKPATFEYTTRGWKLNAYIVSIPFADAVEEVLREFEIQMKVQEDVSGIMSRNTLSAELKRLQNGLNFHRSQYNDPQDPGNSSQSGSSESDPYGIKTIVDTVKQVGSAAGSALGQFSPNLNFLPNLTGGLRDVNPLNNNGGSNSG